MRVINDLLNNIQFGEPTLHRNAVLLPLRSTEKPLQYLTMDEAMEQGTLTITEVFEKGIVSRLTAINSGAMPVLLLDGEELLGGKQNRALNSTILLRPGSHVTIPVSCTEHFRWSQSCNAMMAADVIMPHGVRERKLRSVSASLRACGAFSSDQRGVWQDVAALHLQSQSSSTTFAAADIFRARANHLEDALAAIPLIPHQTGLMVLVGDTVIGFDLLSSPRAYARLHSKLVKSYLLEAILLRRAETGDPAGVKEKAMSFLAAAAGCDAQEFPSAGCGNDWRFTGPNIVGMSLIHDDCLVHALFSRASHADRQPPSSRWSTAFRRFAWLRPSLRSR